MPFEPANQLAKKRKKFAGGRPTRDKVSIKKQAEVIAREFIEEHIKPVLATYIDGAKGHYEKRWTDGDDPKEYEVFVVDYPTTRHCIDKFLPPAKQEIDLISTTYILTTNVKIDDA